MAFSCGVWSYQRRTHPGTLRPGNIGAGIRVGAHPDGIANPHSRTRAFSSCGHRASRGARTGKFLGKQGGRLIQNQSRRGSSLSLPTHRWSANCFLRFSCASATRRSRGRGTLNWRWQCVHSATAGVDASHFTTLRLRFSIAELGNVKGGLWAEAGAALVYQPGHGYGYVVVDLTAAAGNPSSCDRRQCGSPNREQEKIGVGQGNLETLEQEANHECTREPEKNVTHAPATAISCDFAGGPAGQHHKRKPHHVGHGEGSLREVCRSCECPFSALLCRSGRYCISSKVRVWYGLAVME